MRGIKYEKRDKKMSTRDKSSYFCDEKLEDDGGIVTRNFEVLFHDFVFSFLTHR